MTDPKPLLPLTPSERRFAEMAFAQNFAGPSGANLALNAACGIVMALRRSHRFATLEEHDAMLAELRREPAPSYSSEVLVAELDRGERCRALLERIVEKLPASGTLKQRIEERLHGEAEAFDDAVEDARKELGLE